MGANTFPHVIPVGDVAAIAALRVSELDSGTLAFVELSGQYYSLFKAGGGFTPNGSTIIQPAAGAPIAGAPGALWVSFSELFGGGGTPLVTPFRMIPVPTAHLANVGPAPPGFQTMFVVVPDVTVLTAGDVLLDFDASILVTPSGGAGVFEGVGFQFLWDGAPLPDGDFFEVDTQAADVFNTITLQARFRSLIVGALPGNHTLEVQWETFAGGTTADSFIGFGNLTIQTAPP
jgi:hypothetical protein